MTAEVPAGLEAPVLPVWSLTHQAAEPGPAGRRRDVLQVSRVLEKRNFLCFPPRAGV